ncbi:MAG: DUF1015 family protein [Acidimicrobiales bacterium]
MVELQTIEALLVEQRHATSVVGPAYDSLLPWERRQLADQNPDSFFNVLRSASDHPDEDDEQLLARNADALAGLIRAGRYRSMPAGLFLYRLSNGDHTQTAVIGDLAVRGVAQGRVRAHERTRVTKEAELARHLAHLRMHSSPVGLGYRAHRVVDDTVAALAAAPPDLNFVSVDGLTQQIWAIHEAGAVDALQRALGEVHTTYIIDGHHRVAAAARLDGEGHFLAALIPDHELRLLPYHRLVAGPLPGDLEGRLAGLADRYDVQPGEPTAPSAEPDGRLDFVLYHGGRWLRLHRRQPAAGLMGATVADEELLSHLFDIGDPRRDPRLSHLPGNRAPQELAELAEDAGRGALVLLAAPSLHDVFDYADAGRVMPPKSTWFEPKLRSGVFVVWR